MEFLPSGSFRLYAKAMFTEKIESDDPIVGRCWICSDAVTDSEAVIENGRLAHLDCKPIFCENCDSETEQLLTVVDSGDPSVGYAAGDEMRVCADCHERLTRRRA